MAARTKKEEVTIPPDVDYGDCLPIPEDKRPLGMNSNVIPLRFVKEVPQVTKIEARMDHTTVHNDTLNPSRPSIGVHKDVNRTGPVRMVSAYVHGVWNYSVPDELYMEYEISNRPMYNEIKEYLKRAEISGYQKGSVVTRRYQPEQHFLEPRYWGIIMNINIQPGIQAPWAPFGIRWITPPDQRFTYETCFAEDLIIVHHALSREYLIDVLDTQGIEGLK